MTDWHTVYDSREEMPPKLDTESSQYTVYERRNIRQETVGDEELSSTQWVYEQREYTKEEYATLTGPQTQSVMQAINEQGATAIMAMLTDTTTLDAVMQALNQQTADIAMIMGGN